jgi:hypothetical protein
LIEQSNNRTIEQSNNQTIKQSSNQTNNQINNQAIKQTIKSTKMSSKGRLAGYRNVPNVDVTSHNVNEVNESWVQANVILPSTLVDASTKNVLSQQEIMRQEAEAGTKPIYRDVGFALLFLGHLAVFSVIDVFYGAWPAVHIDDTTSDGMASFSEKMNQYLPTIAAVIPGSAVLAFVFTYITTAQLLTHYPTLLVKASLYGSLLMYIISSISLFAYHPRIWTFIVAVLLVAVNIWYFLAFYSFIPFAAANLKLAVQAVSSNFGIYFISFVLGLVGCIWTVFWTYTANGLGLFDTSDSDSTIDTSTATTKATDYYYYSQEDTNADIALGLKGFGLILSFYWTLNVIGNITETTTAGVTGTWCFDKNSASKCCSSAVLQSLHRSCTYSLGSICFGSLLNALITALRVAADMARENATQDQEGGAALLYCILQCILSCLEDIIEYFNQWAYVFVGIYGTGYLESGKMVLELFKARGITAIISNGLASYVLTNVMFFSSALCGIFGYVVGGGDAIVAG